MKIIFDYNRTIFDPEKDNLYPGVLLLLKKLSIRHELYLISRNEPKRRIRAGQFGLNEYFRKTIFVNEKTKCLFKDILKGETRALVVGDKITDEIKIGNQLGLITVRIKNGKFASETPGGKDEIANYEANNIFELGEIINRYE